MAEVTFTGKDHGDTAFISRSNHFFITDRSARLDDRSGTGVNDDIELEITDVEELAGPKATSISVLHAAADTWAAGSTVSITFDSVVIAPATNTAVGGNKTNGVPTAAANAVSPTAGGQGTVITFTLVAKAGTGADADTITFAAGTFVDAATGICNDKPIVLDVVGAAITLR